MEIGEWRSNGEIVTLPTELDRIPPFNPVTRKHLWIIINTFEVDPSTWTVNNPPTLGDENLISVSGPGCFYCELPWSHRLSLRVCLGHPTSPARVA